MVGRGGLSDRGEECDVGLSPHGADLKCHLSQSFTLSFQKIPSQSLKSWLIPVLKGRPECTLLLSLWGVLAVDLILCQQILFAT